MWGGVEVRILGFVCCVLVCVRYGEADRHGWDGDGDGGCTVQYCIPPPWSATHERQLASTARRDEGGSVRATTLFPPPSVAHRGAVRHRTGCVHGGRYVVAYAYARACVCVCVCTAEQRRACSYCTQMQVGAYASYGMALMRCGDGGGYDGRGTGGMYCGWLAWLDWAGLGGVAGGW